MFSRSFLEFRCICRQPYDDRFMICCDCCEEWFHGKCVGITKVQGRNFERLGKEWFCTDCDVGIQNNVERSVLKVQADTKRKEREAREKASKNEAKRKKAEIKIKKPKTPVKKLKVTKESEQKSQDKSPVKNVSKDNNRKTKKDKIDINYSRPELSL